jgi:cephalosporin hydroxylase
MEHEAENTIDPRDRFAEECRNEIVAQGKSESARDAARTFMLAARPTKYCYHFRHLGRPIIQYPQDIVAIQELVWRIRPDLIIETGIAHGGSLILSASMLALLDYCDAVEHRQLLDPSAGRRCVLGIDIDIRAHNRKAIESHPLAHKIDMLQGSSIDAEIISRVHEQAAGYEKILVCLDSSHTHDHVLAELEAYAPLVTPGSYCVVFDTVIEDRPQGYFRGSAWDKGNNPKTAVWQFLKMHPEFELDNEIVSKLLITVAPGGFLRRVR